MNGVELVASWFTPTVLFCVMNLMIGTIFFRSGAKSSTANKHQNNHQHSPPQQHYHQQQFDRAPSFFERVKSFNMSRSEIQQTDPAHHAVAPAEENTAVAVQAEEIRRETKEPHHNVARTVTKAAPESHEEEIRGESQEPHHVVIRTKSDAVTKAAPALRILKKSASERVLTWKEEEEEEEEEERRWPETARARPSGDGEVDGKADDFIIKFRQQLKLQRMDSIVRYNDTIDRGSGEWR